MTGPTLHLALERRHLEGEDLSYMLVDVATFRLTIIEHRQYGLDGHSRCEGDISATRRDYYINNGDNHNAYPDRFKRLIELAKQNGGKFDVDTLNKFYAQNAQLSINENPRLYFQA